MAVSNTLKSLQAEANQLRKDITRLKNTISDASRKMSAKHARLETVENQLAQLVTHHGIIISEHALLRYVERGTKVDMAELERTIVTPELLSQVATLGDGEYTINGLRAVIKNNIIITFKA